jgi:hypothetical protein
VKKLKNLNVKLIYPGHGTPFAMDQFQVNAAIASSSVA